MSNYPPGVTGNEWQIAGADERVIEVECEEIVKTGDPEDDEAECGFKGDVDSYSIDGETWVWDCPKCGAEELEKVISQEWCD